MGVAIAVLLIAAATRGVLRSVGELRGSVATACALLVCAAAPLWPGRFGVPLDIGILIVGALVTPVAWGELKRGCSQWRARAWSRGAIVASFVLVGLLSVTVCTTYLFDEDSGHFPLTSSLARGVMPPEHPHFPGEPFAYHTGFDVLAALVLRASHGLLRVERAIDVAAIACAICLAWTLHDVGERIAGRRGALLALLLVPCAFGVLVPCLADMWALNPGCAEWLPRAWQANHAFPYPVVVAFFQHPFGLGLPGLLAVLLLGVDGSRSPGRAATTMVACGLLSASHAPSFAVATGTLLGIGALQGVRARSLRVVAVAIACAVGALLVAYSLGGMFGAPGVAGTLAWGGHFGEDSFGAAVVHNVVVFGTPLLVVPLSLWRLRLPEERKADWTIAMLLLALGGFLLPNAFHYVRSHDVNKLFVFGVLGGAFLLVRECRDRSPLFVAVVLAVSVPTGVLWQLRHSVLNGVAFPRYADDPPSSMSVAMHDAVGEIIAPRERVLASDPGLAAATGFRMVGVDWRVHPGFLVDRASHDHVSRVAVRALRELDPADIDALAISIVILDAGEVAALSEVARARLADTSRFTVIARVRVGTDERIVLRVTPRPGE